MHEESIRWPDGNIMALSVVVNVEEGSEMTVARGDRGMEPVDELGIHIRSPIRNYGNESNYLYGIKAGAPRIVRLFKTLVRAECRKNHLSDYWSQNLEILSLRMIRSEIRLQLSRVMRLRIPSAHCRDRTPACWRR